MNTFVGFILTAAVAGLSAALTFFIIQCCSPIRVHGSCRK